MCWVGNYLKHIGNESLRHYRSYGVVVVSEKYQNLKKSETLSQLDIKTTLITIL